MTGRDINTRIQRVIRPQVLAARAYQVSDPGDCIKLDAMENPYPLPEAVRTALAASLAEVSVNRYPDAAARALKARLRGTLGLSDDQPLVLGNGSDELIQLIAMAVAGSDVTLMAPEPGFVMYRLLAEATGCRFTGVPLNGEDFALDLDAMLAAIERDQPAVVFLAWPNNPTGNLFEHAAIERILASAPGLVVIDEAYHAFAGDSYLPAVNDHDNLVVLRTLSKLGLAGLRIGLLAGPAAWLDEFDKLRLPYNIGSLNQIAATTVLEQHAVLDEQVSAILEERRRLLAALQAMPGVRVWPSDTNFLLFRLESAPAGRVHQQLCTAGILVKNLNGSHALLADCLRVTVGTPEENARFLQALEEILAGN